MRNILDKYIQKEIKKTGILRISKIGNSDFNRGKVYETIYEIEEVRSTADLTKVKILNMSTSKEDMPEWVNSEMIEWDKK